MATKTISNTGGNWTDGAAWVEGVQPQVGDDVVATATSGSLSIGIFQSTVNLKSFDLSLYNATFSTGDGSFVNIAPTSGTNVCKLGGNSSSFFRLNFSPSANSTVNFWSNGFTNFTITAQGLGTVSLQDDITITYTTSSPTLLLSSDSGSSFITNGYDITTKGFNWDSAGNLDISNSVITSNSTNPVVFSSSGTLTSTGSQIILNETSSTIKNFTGGGNTFGKVTFTGDNILVQGNNTYTDLEINNAGRTNGVFFFSFNSTTTSIQTVTNSFTTNGSNGNIAKVSGYTSGVRFYLKKTSGTVNVSYTSLQDIIAGGGATFNANDGTNTIVSNVLGWNVPGVTKVNWTANDSTDEGNNSGWIFQTTVTTDISTIDGLDISLVSLIDGLTKTSVKTFNGINNI